MSLPLRRIEPPAPPMVLLVEWDAEARLACAAHLRRLEYLVHEAEDGREALAKALANRPSIVVTAARLPGMNGFELCRLLRRDSLTSATPIIMTTSASSESEIELARAAGANAVMARPATPDQMAEEIARALSGAMLRSVSDRVQSSNSEGGADGGEPPPIGRRRGLSHSHDRRATTDPPAPPPAMTCPTCARLMTYVRSFLGGVSAKNAEQWDYYDCMACRGMFEYRQRTRKLRPCAEFARLRSPR